MEGPAVIAPVFLSASEPNPQRSPEYWDTRKLLNVREAVRAFCAHALAHYPVVFGGHPAITPLVRNVAARIAHDAQLPSHGEGVMPPRVVMFQSGLFVDQDSSSDEIVTDPHDENGRVTARKTGMRNESLLRMRYEMLATPTLPQSLRNDVDHWLLRSYGESFGGERLKRLGTDKFSAAVFIGGMEGVVREFRIFRSFHPDTPAFPIASTGSACANLLNEVAGLVEDKDLFAALHQETAYSLLMQKILPVDADSRKASGWREAPPPPFTLAEHCDPVEINRRFESQP